jgi:toxin HigB-1
MLLYTYTEILCIILFTILVNKMKISFSDSKIEELCRDTNKASRKLGPISAKKMQRRLSELLAASVVTDLVAGRPHSLFNDRYGQYALDLDGGKRLIFSPTKQPPVLKDDGGIDWSRVDEVTILEAGDYHD